MPQRVPAKELGLARQQLYWWRQQAEGRQKPIEPGALADPWDFQAADESRSKRLMPKTVRCRRLCQTVAKCVTRHKARRHKTYIGRRQ